MRNWEHRHFEHMRKGVEKSWKSREEVVKIQLGLCGLMPPQVCDLFIQGLHSFHQLQNTRILNRRQISPIGRCGCYDARGLVEQGVSLRQHFIDL